MDNSANFSTSVIWAALIIAAAIVFSASTMSPKVGRYTITPERQNWVIVGDTKTGRSWSCVTTALYKSDSWSQDSDFPKDFEGCLEMSVPSKVQKRVSYDNR
jgi:hypothetical protein